MPTVLRESAESEPEATVAVLIDADNTPHQGIKEIMDASARYGRTTVRRAYGDWTSPALQSWRPVFRDFALKPVQQFQYTTGKNSTDIAMIIDALDLLHKRGIGVFILVTSDSDFTALATRIREEGVMVVGIGRITTPSSFVKGCDQFLLLENMVKSITETTQQVDLSTEQTELRGSGQRSADIEAEGKDLLIRAAKQAADPDGIVKGAFLGMVLKRLDPRFSPSNYGVSKLADFIAHHPDVLVPTGKKSGVDPTYSLGRSVTLVSR